MINLEKLVNNFEEISKRLASRKVEKDFLNEVKEKFLEKKKILTLINNLRRDKNNANKSSSNDLINLKKEIKKHEFELIRVSEVLEKMWVEIPNIPARDVCEENVIVEEKFFNRDFKNSLKYEEIVEKTNFADFKNSSKISGSKFVIYNEEGTKILHSLINFMLNENKNSGYSLVSTPYIVNRKMLYNTGQLPKFSDDLFKIEKNEFFMIPTSEVSLIGIYSNTMIDEKKLPIKLSSYSSCFRAEAGSAGRENKALTRLHQFNKVEIVKITKPENSYEELDSLVKDACKILEKLKITYRVLKLSLSEIGLTSAKTYDIEIWMPNSKKWVEISSCSNCEDFQSNRAKIRSKIKGKSVILHTLNGSSLAIDRLIASILEYYYDDSNNLLEIPFSLKKFYEIWV